MLDDKTLAFADFRGNRQYISIGNQASNDRVALILMDYPRRQRLKIFAHAETKGITGDNALATRVAMPGYRAKVERAILLHLEAFDWNCPQHISPRFSEADLVEVLAPVQGRIEALEAENKALREQVGVLSNFGVSQGSGMTS